MNDALQFAPEPGHPDADQLTAFAEDTLPEHERAQTLTHLATCPTCRQIVFLAQPDEEEILPQPAAARRPLFAGWTLAWVSAGALAGAAILTMSLRSRTSRTPASQPATAAVAPVPRALPAPMPAARPPKPVQPAPTPAAAPPREVQTRSAAAKASVAPSPPENQQAQLLPYSPFLHPQTAAQPALPPVSHGIFVGSGSGAGSGIGVSGGVASAAPPPKPALGVAGAVSLAPGAPAVAAPLAPLPATARAQTVTVTANQVSVDPGSNSSATILTGKDLDGLSDDAGDLLAPLPSHLAIASRISNGARTVAIDTGGAVFVSKDSGKHWGAVSAKWPGRAVRVSLAGPADEGRAQTSIAAAAAAPAAAPKRAASADSAQISGTVTDPSGASVPRAFVTLRAIDRAEIQTTRTDAAGRFIIVGLPPGSYRLQVDAPGFETSVRTVELQAGSSVSLAAVLRIGQEDTTVEVNDAAPIQTENAAVSTRQLKTSRESARKVSGKPLDFQITTDSGAVWTSSDGHKWKPK